jgi:hypothetical protein
MFISPLFVYFNELSGAVKLARNAGLVGPTMQFLGSTGNNGAPSASRPSQAVQTASLISQSGQSAPNVATATMGWLAD